MWYCSFTHSKDRQIPDILLPLSISLYTQRHIYVLHVMCVFASIVHVSTSVWVCVSQHFSVSVWVVTTRNNTLPWDLLNGHHLSISGRALGKLMLQLRCFLPGASQNEPASLLWKEKKEKLQNKIENLLFLRKVKVNGKKREWNLTADGISRAWDCDSVIYLQCWEVQPMGHKTFLT